MGWFMALGLSHRTSPYQTQHEFGSEKLFGGNRNIHWLIMTHYFIMILSMTLHCTNSVSSGICFQLCPLNRLLTYHVHWFSVKNWFSIGRSMVFHGFSMVFHGFSMGFPWVFHGFSLGCHPFFSGSKKNLRSPKGAPVVLEGAAFIRWPG